MKYEVGKTYTLTGDETHYRGGTLRDYDTGTLRDFPVEAEFVGVDSEGDLHFSTSDGWAIYVRDDHATETDFDADIDNIESEMVNHPPHYNGHPKGIEAIDVIEDNPFMNLGNAMKYLWRVSWGSKGRDDEDLAKAIWYIERERSRRAKED